jgi:hypothetical protein
LAQGKTLILHDMDEMYYVYDLAIHPAPPGRSRAIDRYARSARFPPRSDDVLVLKAMREARSAILAIERRHPAAGLIANRPDPPLRCLAGRPRTRSLLGGGGPNSNPDLCARAVLDDGRC